MTHREVLIKLASPAIQNDANGRLELYEGVISTKVCPEPKPEASPQADGEDGGRLSTGSGVTLREGYTVSSNWLALLATGVTDVWSRIRKSSAQLVAETIAKEDGKAGALERRQLLLEQTLLNVSSMLLPAGGGDEAGTGHLEDHFVGGSWFCAEGFLLLLKALNSTVTTTSRLPLVDSITASTKHTLLTRYILPLAFHTQVPVRELATQLLVSILSSPSTWFSEEEEVSSYVALVASTTQEVLPRHIDKQSDSHSVACVEGVVTLRMRLCPKAHLPRGAMDKLVGHDAAAIRHATAEYLCQLSAPERPGPRSPDSKATAEFEGDLLSALFELLEPVESALSGDGGKWEVEETRLMAMYLFTQQMVKNSTPPEPFWPLPVLPIANAAALASQLLTCHDTRGRFEVKRIVGQLVPLWTQYVARLVPAQPAYGVLSLQKLSQEFQLPGHGTLRKECAMVLDFFLALQKFNEDNKTNSRVSSALTTCRSTFVGEVYGHAQETPLLLDAWGKLTQGKAKLAAAPTMSPPELEMLVATTPDFVALRVMSADLVTSQFLPLWAKALTLGHITLPSHQRMVLCSVQRLLTTMLLGEEGKSKELPDLDYPQLFGTFLVPEMKPPIFEDDLDGVGQGLYYIARNRTKFPETTVKDVSEQRKASNGETNLALAQLEAIAQSIGSDPSSEPAVVDHLRSLLLFYLTHVGGTQPPTAFIKSCTIARLDAVCGGKWREGNSSSGNEPKKGSADDWDDSDDDDDDVHPASSGSPGGGDPVQGISVPTELAKCLRVFQSVRSVQAEKKVASELDTMEEDIKIIERLLKK